jgi:dTDP-4-amino-4,6-dideoxygalactose transaminase
MSREEEMKLTVPSVGKEELEAVGSVLDSGWLTSGPIVEYFEERVSEYVGTKYAIAVTNCTSALLLSLLSLPIPKGSKVAVPDFTFPATANAVILAGLEPVLIDIDLDTYCINLDLLDRAISNHDIKAIVPVHPFGYPCDMKAIMDMTENKWIYVIEDAACAFSARVDRKPVGAWGDVGCFSFHPRKPITTGEGGVIVTDSFRVDALARSLRNHGKKDGKFVRVGYNFRMSDILAAVGIKQIEKWLEKRLRLDQLAKLYFNALEGIEGITLPAIHPGRIWQSFVIQVKERDGLMEHLRNHDIETTFGTYALHLESAFTGYWHEYPSKSRRAYCHSLTLPFYDTMTERDIGHVAERIREF